MVLRGICDDIPIMPCVDSRDVAKTLSFLTVHLLVGFTVAYLLTGSFAVASGIAMIEPMVNAVVFFFHERAWRGEFSFGRLMEHRHKPFGPAHWRWPICFHLDCDSRASTFEAAISPSRGRGHIPRKVPAAARG